jgi:hypothetical protein
MALISREAVMSFDAMLVTAAVLCVFAAFVAVRVWGDFQARPARLRTQVIAQKRRSL